MSWAQSHFTSNIQQTFSVVLNQIPHPPLLSPYPELQIFTAKLEKCWKSALSWSTYGHLPSLFYRETQHAHATLIDQRKHALVSHKFRA